MEGKKLQNDLVMGERSSMLIAAIFITAFGIFFAYLFNNLNELSFGVKLLPLALVALGLISFGYGIVTYILDKQNGIETVNTKITHKFKYPVRSVFSINYYYYITTTGTPIFLPSRVTSAIYDSVSKGQEVVIEFKKYSRQIVTVTVKE